MFFIGGVAQYHTFWKNIIEDKFNIQVTMPPNPQLINAFGVVCLAMKQLNQKGVYKRKSLEQIDNRAITT